MDPKEFRKEVVKMLPGFKWTVHKSRYPEAYLSATGIQSAGSNRLATIQVERRDVGRVSYEVKSSGYGVKAPWLGTGIGGTLAKALRILQSDYEYKAAKYGSHALILKNARKAQ